MTGRSRTSDQQMRGRQAQHRTPMLSARVFVGVARSGTPCLHRRDRCMKPASPKCALPSSSTWSFQQIRLVCCDKTGADQWVRRYAMDTRYVPLLTRVALRLFRPSLAALALLFASGAVSPASADSILLGTRTLNTANDLTLIDTGGNALEFLDLSVTRGQSVATAVSTHASDGFHWPLARRSRTCSTRSGSLMPPALAQLSREQWSTSVRL